MDKILIGTDPHTKEPVEVEVTRWSHNRRLGYRLTWFGKKHDLVFGTDGQWIDRREATPANSTWKDLEDAEIAATLTLHR